MKCLYIVCVWTFISTNCCAKSALDIIEESSAVKFQSQRHNFQLKKYITLYKLSESVVFLNNNGQSLNRNVV